jgi:RimJ/RimL family protein N-acetyltransferase
MKRPSGIVLAPLGKDDLPTLFSWINDREQVLWSAPYRPVSESDHETWFREVSARTDVVIFAIKDGASARLVGTCQLTGIEPVHRCAELRIRIGEPSFRGLGYGSLAVDELLRFGFADLNLNRIYLYVFRDNAPALHVYEKAGFVREGLLREAAHIDGRYVDVVVMAILRAEYDRP